MTEQIHFFIDDTIISEKKDGKRVFGDFSICRKNENYTDFILCDGIGSGIKASVAAKMCATRIATLLDRGMSLKKVLDRIVSGMHGIRTRDIPYAAFIIVRILNDGNFIAGGYEIPHPVVLYDSGAGNVEQNIFSIGGETAFECAGVLKPGMSLILCSDGITQAGMGRGLPMGLTDDGLFSYLDKKNQDGINHKDVVQSAFNHAVELSGGYEDDMSIALLECRKAVTLNVMSGPPASNSFDTQFVNRFLDENGKKVVCGSSTLDMVSRIIGNKITAKPVSSYSQPPEYNLKGIDIAAEGAVTLNRLYNILDETQEDFDEESIVTELFKAIYDSDIIRFYIGDAYNSGHESIIFRQKGILPRKTIISMIIEKLKKSGKVVTIISP